LKRQILAIEAMKYAPPGLRLVIAGTGDNSAFEEETKRQAVKHGVADRIEFTGWVSEERKAELMAGSLGVLYLAYDEDSYGYVTLEAFHSSKPVITLEDCGGSLEVIEDGFNGLIRAPSPESLGDAMTRLWNDRDCAVQMGTQAHATIARHRIDWDHVIRSLTA
jgi:glycosyltransferase involved in cell wall biosynthesis